MGGVRSTHVIDAAGDPKTRCGLKLANSDEGLPVVLAKYVSMHVVGHGMDVCETCSRGVPA